MAQDDHQPINPADLELSLARVGDRFDLTLRLSWASAVSDLSRGPFPVTLNVEALLAHALDPTAYGAALRDALFADPAALTAFAEARTAIAAGRLRVRLLLPQELQPLRWETLLDPRSGRPLALESDLLLTRYIVADDYQRVMLRPRSALCALVAVAAPTNLADYRLAPIDARAEIVRMRAALQGFSPQPSALNPQPSALNPGISVDALGDAIPCTIEALGEWLRKGAGYDMLYLLAHGAFINGTPRLYLADAAGRVAVKDGSMLADLLRNLGERRPRLVVLASCASAGDGFADSLAALGPLLARAGVPAVLAMQGQVSTATVAQLMPVFLSELLRDGLVDRALALARLEVRERDDWWLPVLYSRLRTGRIYSPGQDADPGGNGWEELQANQRYRQYRLPAHASPWVRRMLKRPGCYVVEAQAHQGKTALIRYLWQELQKSGYEVVGYIFHHERRHDVEEAIRQIRHQLQQLGLLEPGATESPSLPWFQIDRAAQAGRRLAVLIDALDESAHEQRHLLDRLLPPFQFEHLKLVVTSRQPLREYKVELSVLLPNEATLRLDNFTEADIRGLAQQLKVANGRQLTPRVLASTDGRPWQVAAILRSGNPEVAMEQPIDRLVDVQLIVQRDLADMGHQAHGQQADMLRRLQALLAVAPADLAFDELRAVLGPTKTDLEELKGLCDRLARHIKVGERYCLRSPDVRAHILQNARDLGDYADAVRTMRSAVATWYRQCYEQPPDQDLSRLPRHVLRHILPFVLETDTHARFPGERIVADPRWYAALDDGFETIADLRDAVRDAWRVAEQISDIPRRMLAVTSCALVLGALAPAFSPEAVADLVRRGLVNEPQARRYAEAYPSPRERAELLHLLHTPAPQAVDHQLGPEFDRLAHWPPAERPRRLNQLHRRLASARPGASKCETLIDALRAEHHLWSSAQPTAEQRALTVAPAPTRVLSELIDELKATLVPATQPAALPLPDERSPDGAPSPFSRAAGELVGLAAQQGLSNEQIDLLSEIAAVWASDEPFSADYYAQITRLFADSPREVYCDALSTLAPAIGRVFGAACLATLITIVETITQVYP